MAELRAALYRQLDPLEWAAEGLSPVNRAVLMIVSLSVLAVVIQSEPGISRLSPKAFVLLNAVFAIAFSIEYGVRLWAIGANPRYRGPLGIVRYVLSLASVLDLVATAALWIDLFLGVPGAYGVLLRLVRVLRVITLMRKSRWAAAIRLLGRAISNRRTELWLSLGFAGIVLLFAATILFAVEGQAQPEAFGSIPRAMWWAIVTLTTVGYGDVFPLTPIGKLCAGLVALTSVAIVAMPTGILAAAFSDAFQSLRRAKDPKALEASNRKPPK